MRLQLPSALTLLCLGLFQRAARAEDATDAIAALPDCAAECLLTAVADSTCAPTNQTCICMNEPLQEEVELCVRASCTIKESLTTMNTTAIACNAPVRDQTKSLNLVATVLGVISGVVVLFRLVFKFWTGLGISLDDWFILVTVIFGAPNTAISIHGTVPNGLGRDIWTLPFETVTRFGFFFYIMEILYFSVVTLLKVSILFFYLRIFPDAKVRRVLWATQSLNALSGVAFVLVAIFQCSPISYFWTNWDGEHEGKCANINAIVWANAIISIVFDICMLAIPLSQLHKLKLHWKRKVGVGMMFTVGTFVTIVSILRLQSIVHFARHSENPTWANAAVSNWSFIEINVGIICACMPTMRLALARGFRVFRETTVRGGYYSREYQRQGSTSGGLRSGRATTVAGGTNSSSGGVAYKRTFAVEYSQRDDSSMVPMTEFEVHATNSTRAGSAESNRSASEATLERSRAASAERV